MNPWGLKTCAPLYNCSSYAPCRKQRPRRTWGVYACKARVKRIYAISGVRQAFAAVMVVFMSGSWTPENSELG
jgi:hypothetical protein